MEIDMTQLHDASLRQIEAADPLNSTWVSANAGSGKTRVLTDRVARLLLEGVVPENILCLTYTKAAATEMQNRLFARLGSWAMMPDDKLVKDLSDLGIVQVGAKQTLIDARRLFAKAIETPGGLKIQTIHSFCASLLRRFPLEAKVSPQFVEMEDRSAQMLRMEVVEDMANGDLRPIVDEMAAHYANDDIERLTSEVARHGAALLNSTPDRIRDAFNITETSTIHDCLSIAFDGSEVAWWNDAVDLLKSQTAKYKNIAADWALIDPKAPKLADLEMLYPVLLDKNDQWNPRLGRFPQANHTKVRDALQEYIPEIEALMERLFAAKQYGFSLDASAKSIALHHFAAAFLPRYEAKKTTRGWLDFDDLIRKARGLLTDPLVAQWVLFRLDGGIDHILVDEAQDTSPEQWKVIEQLAQEFTTGQSARSDVHRTLFVVGDPKQSIYSFQGADPDGFQRMRAFFQDKLAEIEAPFKSLQMEFSFRSSPAILSVVDHTFDPEEGTALIAEMKHRACKDQLPGRVDCWPVVEKTDTPDPTPWSDPIDRLSERDSVVVLADQIAAQIKNMIDTKTAIPDPDADGGYRAIRPKDILVLVQRRSAIFSQIIRACKAAGLAIAGADRLKIGGELAVKDITAVLRFLATPEDSFSLACALKSPLCGLDEQDIYTIAHKREKRYLWAHLRGLETEYPTVLSVLNDLRRQADYLRPYELIERLLTRHGGRKALLARLGTEAEDGIDALLDQALSYERTEVPSLTGFLIWLDADEVEIKRQIDSASDQMRVMTVHGAKGLEAPIVFLPDTAKRAITLKDQVVKHDNLALWKTSATATPALISNAITARKAAETDERSRLLYVAMTRAEKWLIVCAAGDVGEEDDSWYSQIQRGMQAAGAGICDFDGRNGTRYQSGHWPDHAASKNDPIPSEMSLDAFYATTATKFEKPNPILTPTDLPGPKALPSELGHQDEQAAMLLGTAVHHLLETLPLLPADQWKEAGQAYLNTVSELTDQDAKSALAQCLAVLSNTDLSEMFASTTLAEVDISASMPTLDGQRLRGTIDRLIVTDDAVWAVDYKTNAAVPRTPNEVPLGILRQMGAYGEALAQVFPDKDIKTSLLWTATAELMHLPHDIVRDALETTPTS
jgi:ATP-dependent helicase/nuclease subunit A